MQFLKATTDNLRTASQIVIKGGIVVFPTDTVYGLGCDPFNIDAVNRILKIKGERKKPLPILALDLEHVEKIASLSKEVIKIAKKFWPGILTIVVPKRQSLSQIVTYGLDSVAVRVPSHGIARRLLRFSNGLLVGTSANKTGDKPPKTALEAEEKIGQEVDIIFDGGPATFATPSTIVDLTSEKPKLLRKGNIDLRDILEIL